MINASEVRIRVFTNLNASICKYLTDHYGGTFLLENTCNNHRVNETIMSVKAVGNKNSFLFKTIIILRPHCRSYIVANVQINEQYCFYKALKKFKVTFQIQCV